MRLAAGLALAGLAAAAGCAGDERPPDDASVMACVRESGARVERGRLAPGVPRGARPVVSATWPGGAGALVFRAGDAEAADRAEDELRRIARAFRTPEDQVKRDGVFLTLLGPAHVPADEDAEALADCLS
jgi:hypothetical protein